MFKISVHLAQYFHYIMIPA